MLHSGCLKYNKQMNEVQILKTINITYPSTKKDLPKEDLPSIMQCMNHCIDRDDCKSITITNTTSNAMCYLYNEENIDTSEVQVLGSISANKECFDEIEGI